MKLLLTLLSCLLLTTAWAQPTDYWQPVAQNAAPADLFTGKFKPASYQLFKLQEQPFISYVKNAPSENTTAVNQSNYIIAVPVANGMLEKFRIAEAPVMHPQLSAKYPLMKSYIGKGISDPSAILRFDISPNGFHGMVISAKRPTIYIDPLGNTDKHYVVFLKSDAIGQQGKFTCLVDSLVNRSGLLPSSPTGGLRANDGKLRTFRLALACTGEYAQYFLDGTETSDSQRKAKVIAAMNTMMTRINGIYEKDFAIRMNLISNNDAIVYLNPATDPWTNEWNYVTQQTIDNVIGDPNYDIGHLVHRLPTAGNNNGNAGCIGCVCKTSNGNFTPGNFVGKGGAFTSHFQPTGDPFVVDFTAHEMGHQFGANHTFTFSNEGTPVQVEPGSGSTIMGYAGITGPTDVQPNSDDYFHAHSLDQIFNYVTSTPGGCAAITTTGNSPPVANAGQDYTIPPATAFRLKGTGSDPDVADILTFTWEQMDVGGPATTYPNGANVTGPMVRSRKGTTNPERIVPEYPRILDGSYGSQWERLSGVNRPLNFRLTVRDNHPGGGGTASDDCVITVSTASGPLEIPVPASGVVWPAGSTQTVTWTGNTTSFAANVKISLSTDNGATFPYVLLQSTPNDGSADVVIPSGATTDSATIMIEAIGNIFFDISDLFKIFTFAVTSPNTAVSYPAESNITVTWSGNTAALSPNVKISLSTDGGNTFPTVLAASVPNNNSAQVTLPNISTTQARIKVESIGANAFFDISDVNFTITPKPIICKRADIQIYKRDTSFTSIASDDNGFVYAGTQTMGLFRLENNQFKNYSYGLNGLIPWKRTWIRQMMVANNQLWVAHSGFIFNNLGNVDYFFYGGTETINVLNGPGDRINRRGQRIINIDLTIAGPPTRNTMGVFADTATGKVWAVSDYADSVAYPELYNYTARYWYKTGGVGIMNPGQTNFFRNEQGYPAPFNIGVGTNMAGAESNSNGKRKGNISITATPTEILTTCRGYQAVGDTLFKPGIMRYDRFTGAYIGKYDQTNTGLPFGLTNTTAAAPAIYTDAKNRVWLALGGNRLAVMDTSGWHYIGVPGSLAGGGTIQPNAISGDRRGVVYFGTDAGLLVFDNNKDTSGIASYTKDSSYCIYTTTEGLPSNYIRGTHVDRSGNIWLATGSGICRMQRGDLLMYNLLPQPAANYITNSDAKRTVVAGFDPDFANPDTIRIAADGSQATLFKWQGKDPAKLKAIIKEGNTAPDFGSLTVVHRSIDSFAVQYKHPEQLSGAFAAQGKRDLTLQLFDTTFAPPKLIIDVKFTVVRPPILCLHGIWSSGDMYTSFKQYLVDSAGYKDFMVGTPNYPNDVSFTANQFVARDEAANLLQQCADNNFSAGKVDIVSHSMGGILSRIFLQSTAYEHTINKLITVNTPHSGSQLADLVRSSPALQAVVNNLLGNNTENGGMDDLRVTQDGIRVLLNGPANLNRNKVPSHAITSRYTDLQVYEVLVDAALTFASYIPALGKIAKVAKTTLAILKYAAYSGTTCNTNETIHECLRNKIYEDDNDLAVALGSQRGGLPPSAISYYDNYSHNSIMDQPPVFNRLNFLLKAPNNDGAFTTNGYNPLVLNYNASLRMPSSPSTETVDIVTPVSGATYAAGQSFTVDIVGSANIQKHLVAIGNETLGAKYYNNVSRNFNFTHTIPLGAIGKIYMVAIGFDNLGKVTFDTAFINVGVPVGVTLDSIRISDKRKLKVYQADSMRLTINAFYSDTVRDISNMPGVSYVIDDVNVKASAMAPNYIVGLLEGYDFFRATWQGKTDTGYIQVLPKPLGPGTGVIPVTLTSFTGKLVGNAVQLKWNTAQEINASHFEVERSVDGVNFSYIGQVKAVGQSNSNSNYGFNDLQFKTGANYYRLKQVDIDGRFTYSIVVLIRVKKGNQPDVLIFPNPAQKHITVNVTEGQHPQWNLQVQNMMGQPVLRHIIPANQNNEQIALGQLTKGVYTVTILSANGEKIYNGKLVVQ